MNNKDYFIFGKPIDTELGKVRFLNYYEYFLLMPHLSIISMNVLHIYYSYKKASEEEGKNSSDITEAIEEIKKGSLYEVVTSIPEILESYVTVFKTLWKNESTIEKIFSSEEMFSFYRELIMEMNLITEEPVSPNPEIQRGLEMSKEMRNEEKDSLKPLDIVTSIVAHSSFSFEEVSNMTIFQVNALFSRISAFKNYDTTVHFATVSPDVKIEPWSKSIDLYEKEQVGIKKKDFMKKYGGLL